MDAKQFKKAISECLKTNGFIKDGKYFRKIGDGVVCNVRFQKSGYSNGYYINFGYTLTELDASVDPPPKTVDGHIGGRFYYNNTGKQDDLFYPENFSDQDELRRIMQENLDELLPNTLNIDGIKDLLARRPVMLYQTTLAAKRFLGFE